MISAKRFELCRRLNPAGLINTLLQRGDGGGTDSGNRFNGFRFGVETVETVARHARSRNTPLKQGVNEKTGRKARIKCEIYGTTTQPRLHRP